MFALDDLIRSAVKISVNILNPEFEAPFEDAKMPRTSSTGIPTPIVAPSPVPPAAQPSLDLQRSLSVVQNFVKRLAFELENSGTGSSGPQQPSSSSTRRYYEELYFTYILLLCLVFCFSAAILPNWIVNCGTGSRICTWTILTSLESFQNKNWPFMMFWLWWLVMT